jgi:multiple antibiotic resistance protein
VNWALDSQLLGETFITLLVIMDPPGILPVFLALTIRNTSAQRSRSAFLAVWVSLTVIVLFAVFGQGILNYLNVSLPALQCSGGLLLLLIALELLTGKDSDTGNAEGVNIAFVPLGTPLLAGPGAIVATMLFVHHAGSEGQKASVALGILAVHVLLYLTLRFSTIVHRVLRESGVTLVTRIAGLLLSAIAVQMIADAIRAFIEGGG